ncbi:MAG TPA: TspO/MBR family protein, partial [Candidatus Paceibacterota bacterium]|nr:TspO/MBR family protein [Candidatus Paceibacterota bacterium]
MKILNARVKATHIIIPAVTILVIVVGSVITANNMDWYATLNLPSFTPAGWLVSLVWTIIFILTTASAIIVWDHVSHKIDTPIMGMFIVNGFFNVLWSYEFFALHQINAAVWAAAMLVVTVVILILLIAPHRKDAAWMLVPYLGWAAFATYLTY